MALIQEPKEKEYNIFQINEGSVCHKVRLIVPDTDFCVYVHNDNSYNIYVKFIEFEKEYVQIADTKIQKYVNDRVGTFIKSISNLHEIGRCLLDLAVMEGGVNSNTKLTILTHSGDTTTKAVTNGSGGVGGNAGQIYNHCIKEQLGIKEVSEKQEFLVHVYNTIDSFNWLKPRYEAVLVRWRKFDKQAAKLAEELVKAEENLVNYLKSRIAE